MAWSGRLGGRDQREFARVGAVGDCLARPVDLLALGLVDLLVGEQPGPCLSAMFLAGKLAAADHLEQLAARPSRRARPYRVPPGHGADAAGERTEQRILLRLVEPDLAWLGSLAGQASQPVISPCPQGPLG